MSSWGLDRAESPPSTAVRAPTRTSWAERLATIDRGVYATVGVYLASRVLLLAVALVAGATEHEPVLSELGRWDGTWYVSIASHGYPTHVLAGKSNLGFFPLLPIVVWLVVHAPGPPNSTVVAGVLVCTVGGLIATLLVQQLARGWWGERVGRRAAWLFCFFPGSIVFSMVYGEGLLIPLAAGCMLALERRRWALAGLLAGIGTAVQPDGVALFVMCSASAAVAVARAGWRNADARRSLLAPLLSLAGVAAFAAFLWSWTGTPFAALETQSRGWDDHLNPLAFVHQLNWFSGELAQFDLGHPAIYLSPLAALLGVPVLLVGIALLLRRPREVSVAAHAWTLTIAALALFGENLGANPRFLITAFPAVVVLARYCSGRRYGWLLGTTTALLVLTSALTYGGHSLTP